MLTHPSQSSECAKPHPRMGGLGSRPAPGAAVGRTARKVVRGR
ncbi:MAG: hypothetical protein Q4E55_09470 [Bacteroidales bacterium]|nr:hypothetical protein [Bacteroidales bacterium]